MTVFAAIFGPAPEGVGGLVEDLVSWNGGLRSRDPRRFRLGSVAVTWSQQPAHLLRLVQSGSSTHALELDETLVGEWRRGHLTALSRADLRALFDALSAGSAEWTLVCDPDAAGGPVVRECSAVDAFEAADAMMTGRHDSVALLVVRASRHRGATGSAL